MLQSSPKRTMVKHFDGSDRERTPEMNELLAATGYMRTILDITHEDISNLPVERYEALFKLVEKVGSSTLGLTVGCVLGTGGGVLDSQSRTRLPATSPLRLRF